MHYQDTVLTFGNYKGKPFDLIPLEYLTWLFEQNWVFNDLKHKIETYISFHGQRRLMEIDEGIAQEDLIPDLTSIRQSNFDQQNESRGVQTSKASKTRSKQSKPFNQNLEDDIADLADLINDPNAKPKKKQKWLKQFICKSKYSKDVWLVKFDKINPKVRKNDDSELEVVNSYSKDDLPF